MRELDPLNDILDLGLFCRAYTWFGGSEQVISFDWFVLEFFKSVLHQLCCNGNQMLDFHRFEKVSISINNLNIANAFGTEVGGGMTL